MGFWGVPGIFLCCHGQGGPSSSPLLFTTPGQTLPPVEILKLRGGLNDEEHT